MTPNTLQEAIIYFSDFENCQRTMIDLRWSDGVVRCPYCQSDKATYLPSGKVWRCANNHPRRKFSLKVGTVFEDSPIGLDKWFTAMWLVANCENGVSSYEIHRAIKVTQKTAWFMDHRIRLAMQTGSFEKVSGEFEVDESFIGGLARNMHKNKKAKITGTGGAAKAIVMGLLDRKTKKFDCGTSPTLSAKRFNAWCTSTSRAALTSSAMLGSPTTDWIASTFIR